MPSSRVSPGIPENEAYSDATCSMTLGNATVNQSDSTDSPALAVRERKRLQTMMDELMHQTSPIGSQRLLEIESAMNGVDGDDDEGDGGGYGRVLQGLWERHWPTDAEKASVKSLQRLTHCRDPFMCLRFVRGVSRGWHASRGIWQRRMSQGGAHNDSRVDSAKATLYRLVAPAQHLRAHLLWRKRTLEPLLRDPSPVLPELRAGRFQALPGVTKHGNAVILVRGWLLGKSRTREEDSDVNICWHAFALVMEHALARASNPLARIIILYDRTGPAHFLRNFDFQLMQKFTSEFIRHYPERWGGAFCFPSNKFLRLVARLVIPLPRVFFPTDMQLVASELPLHLIPQSWGGGWNDDPKATRGGTLHRETSKRLLPIALSRESSMLSVHSNHSDASDSPASSTRRHGVLRGSRTRTGFGMVQKGDGNATAPAILFGPTEATSALHTGMHSPGYARWRRSNGGTHLPYPSLLFLLGIVASDTALHKLDDLISSSKLPGTLGYTFSYTIWFSLLAVIAICWHLCRWIFLQDFVAPGRFECFWSVMRNAVTHEFLGMLLVFGACLPRFYLDALVGCGFFTDSRDSEVDASYASSRATFILLLLSNMWVFDLRPKMLLVSSIGSWIVWWVILCVARADAKGEAAFMSPTSPPKSQQHAIVSMCIAMIVSVYRERGRRRCWQSWYDAQDELRATCRELDHVNISHSSTPAFETDGDLYVLSWPNAMQQLTGFVADEVIGRPLHRVLATWACQTALDEIQQRIAAKDDADADADSVDEGFDHDITFELAFLCAPTGYRDGKPGAVKAANELSASDQALHDTAYGVSNSTAQTNASVLKWLEANVLIQRTDGVAGCSVSVVGQDITKHKQVDSARTTFLASFSHELRTPLMGLMGNLDMITQLKFDEPSAESLLKNYVYKATASSNMLLTLVNDILDMSRIQAGKITISDDKFDVRRAIEATLDIVRELAHEKKLDLQVHVHPDASRIVHADVTRFRQVLLNLLSNAIKFTNKGFVRVTVCAEQQVVADGASSSVRRDSNSSSGSRDSSSKRSWNWKRSNTNSPALPSSSRPLLPPLGHRPSSPVAIAGGTAVSKLNPNLRSSSRRSSSGSRSELDLQNKVMLVVHVEDSGIGIRKSDQDKLFQLFSKIRDKRTPNVHGCGLGLSISRRLVTLMGGEISLQSPLTEAGGTRFTMSIPVRCADEEIPSLAHKVEKSLKSQPRVVPLDGKRVLLAEDTEFSAEILQHYVQSANMRSTLAVDGLEAVKSFNEAHSKGDPFDIILMDCLMPRMDGFEATRKIRQNELTLGVKTRVPIIALTALSSEPLKKAKQAGMNTSINKPIGREDLLKSMSQVLDKPEADFASPPSHGLSLSSLSPEGREISALSPSATLMLLSPDSRRTERRLHLMKTATKNVQNSSASVNAISTASQRANHQLVSSGSVAEAAKTLSSIASKRSSPVQSPVQAAKSVVSVRSPAQAAKSVVLMTSPTAPKASVAAPAEPKASSPSMAISLSRPSASQATALSLFGGDAFEPHSREQFDSLAKRFADTHLSAAISVIREQLARGDIDALLQTTVSLGKAARVIGWRALQTTTSRLLSACGGRQHMVTIGKRDQADHSVESKRTTKDDCAESSSEDEDDRGFPSSAAEPKDAVAVTHTMSQFQRSMIGKQLDQLSEHQAALAERYEPVTADPSAFAFSAPKDSAEPVNESWSGRRWRVLVLENDTFCREVLGCMLREITAQSQTDLKMDWADSGAEAMRLIRAAANDGSSSGISVMPVKLVFIADDIPGLRTAAFTRRLRRFFSKRGNDPHVTIVGLGVASADGGHDEWTRSGMDRVVSAPVHQAELRVVLAECLGDPSLLIAPE